MLISLSVWLIFALALLVLLVLRGLLSVVTLLTRPSTWACGIVLSIAVCVLFALSTFAVVPYMACRGPAEACQSPVDDVLDDETYLEILDKSGKPQIDLSGELELSPDGAESDADNSDSTPSSKFVSKQTQKSQRQKSLEPGPASDSPSESLPDWIDQPPKRVGNVQRQVVSSGPYETVDDCYQALDAKLRAVLLDYVEREISGTHVEADVLTDMAIPPGYLRREAYTEQYVQTHETSVGPMKDVHVLLEIDPSIHNELARRWAAFERHQNAMGVSFAGAGVLAFVALAYGLLKVDTWTKGYYSKRLFIGVPLALATLLGLVAACVR